MEDGGSRLEEEDRGWRIEDGGWALASYFLSSILNPYLLIAPSSIFDLPSSVLDPPSSIFYPRFPGR
jgi:hypothetical protein